MDNESTEELTEHKDGYLLVFLALLALTALTVLAAGIEAAAVVTVGVAICIAAVKGGLVAGSFMHLARERPVILSLVVFTACLVALMLGGLVWGLHDTIEGTGPAPFQGVVETSAEEG